LRYCIDEGLVGGENLAVDASLIKADANRQNGIEGGTDANVAGRIVLEVLAREGAVLALGASDATYSFPGAMPGE